MANKEIKDYNQVTTPALTDNLVCQQLSVTYKQTITQILGLIAGLTSASTLDGTETVFIRVSGTNSKVTVDTIANFMIENS